MSDSNKESMFTHSSPKKSFILGFGGAFVLICVVGFFILLSIMLSGKNNNFVMQEAGTGRAPSVVAADQGGKPVNTEISFSPVSDKDWVKGDRNAEISIIEFSDTECPFCKRFHPTMQQLVEEYDGKVNWVYRHFPLASLHSKAPKEAEATECAGELGGNESFWDYIDRLFEITPSNNRLDASQLPEIAEYIGLNREQFQKCLDSNKYAQKVKDQYNEAGAAGGRGTPYSVIVTKDGQKIPVSGAVPIAQFKSIIDPLL